MDVTFAGKELTMQGIAPTHYVLDELYSDEEDVDHLYCVCTPNVALCGEDITELPIVDFVGGVDWIDCAACVERRLDRCILCGHVQCGEDYHPEVWGKSDS